MTATAIPTDLYRDMTVSRTDQPMRDGISHSIINLTPTIVAVTISVRAVPTSLATVRTTVITIRRDPHVHHIHVRTIPIMSASNAQNTAAATLSLVAMVGRRATVRVLSARTKVIAVTTTANRHAGMVATITLLVLMGSMKDHISGHSMATAIRIATTVVPISPQTGTISRESTVLTPVVPPGAMDALLSQATAVPDPRWARNPLPVSPMVYI